MKYYGAAYYPEQETPAQIELDIADEDIYFLFNYHQEAMAVQFDRPLRNALTGQPMQGVVQLAAKEYVVLFDP